MNFKQLTIQGFKSFNSPATFWFSQKLGFNFVTGRNAVETALGANGAGKSSIWDALVWVLYGKTARGLRATAVGSWTSSDVCQVTLLLSHHGADHTVVRTWKPNSLTLDGAETAQDQLEEFIGLNFVCFLNAVLFGQFNEFFLDTAPAAKQALFTDILDLGVWMKYSEKAKRLSELARKEVDEISNAIAGLEASKAENAALLAQIAAASKAFQQTLATRVAEAEKKLEVANNAERHYSRERQLLEEEKSKVGAQFTAVEAQMDTLEKTQDEIEAQLLQVNSSIMTLRGTIKAYETDLARLLKLSDRCPICKQAITKAHLTAERQRIETAQADIQRQITAATEGEYAKLTRQRKEIAGELADLAERVRLLSKSYNNLEEQVNQVHAKQVGSQREAAVLTSNLEEMKAQVDPHKEQIAALNDRIRRADIALVDARANHAGVEHEHKASTFWASEFKQVRLYLIEAALAELEVRVNNSLIQLGLPDWTVTFDVERENTSGGVTRGFTMLIDAPHVEGNVPWEAWSGGESQRLRLAGQIGLSSLILSRCGVDCSQEIWDEPTSHMSEEGIRDLLELLRSRADTEKREVWLVDHRSLAHDFDRTVTVVKDQSGSHIV